jgi:glycosyltransferase involved in cell wall biosynthesis
MTIHLVSLVHTETTRAWEFCAYTSRNRKWATMMSRLGYDVRLYAGEANEAECAEHIPLVTRAEQRAWFPDYDPTTSAFNDFDPAGIGWSTFNERAAAAIRERAQPGDILAITMGLTHRPVAVELVDLDLLHVEIGVGYTGVWAPYRVFETNAWRSFMAALEPSDDLRWYDATIPCFWEPEAFPAGAGDGGYFLFMGRLIGRKGVSVASETCQRLGAKLLIAGQGVASVKPGRIVTTDGTVLEGDVEYVGVVAPAERATLMGGAIATFAPTMYHEPGGGVAVEAQLTGSPVLATPYGAFPELIHQGATGFLCSTLAEFVAAGKAAPSLDRAMIREQAMGRFSTDVVGPQYAAYLDRLATLRGDGWYSIAEPVGVLV